MDSQVHLRTKILVFSVGLDKQVVSSRIQIGVSDGMLSTGTVPVIGEACQLVDDVIFIGGYIIGSGELDAEHGLVGIEGYFGSAVQGLLQDARIVSHLYFRTVHDEA